MIAATPTSSNRRAISSAVSSEVPALPRHLSVARGEPHRDLPRIIPRGLAHEGRVAHGCGADDHAGDALLQPCLHGRGVANAAAELKRNRHGFEDAVDRGGVHRLAGEGAVEIDDMEIFEALRLEGVGLGGGVAVEHGGARRVALLEAHAQAVFEIDGGKENHVSSRLPLQGFHCRKLAMSARPRRWLFSGWNWVPAKESRATTAVTGPP